MTYNKFGNLAKIFMLTILILCQLRLTFFVKANEKILFYDDFSDGLANWNSVGYILPEVVADGAGNNVARFRHNSMRGGDVNWTDYQAEIKFRLLPDTGDAFYRFEFNVRCDEGNTTGIYSARFQYSSGIIYYQVWKGSQNVVNIQYKNTTPLEKVGTGWHVLSMRVMGDTLSGYLDEEELFSKTLPDIPGRGNIYISWYKTSSMEQSVRHGEIDYVKVIDASPFVLASPQVIVADDNNSSLINVNWIPNGYVRVAGNGVTMLDAIGGQQITEAITSEEGYTSFKLKGTVAGKFPLELSLDGSNWWKPLSDQKAIELVSVAHPKNSSVDILGWQEGQSYPATGAKLPVTVKVKIVFYDNKITGDFTRQRVSLRKTSVGPGVISDPVIITTEREATFTATSIEAGTVILEAQVVPVDENNNPITGIQPVNINQKVAIVFDQAISPTNSSIEIVGSTKASTR